MQGFDPHRLTAEDDPYPIYREMREEHPLYYSEEREIWVVSRYADVRATLLDAGTWASGQGTVPSGFLAEKPMLISEDPPYHTHLRGAVHLSFTPRRMRALEKRVREIAVELLDAVDPEADTELFSTYTDPLPVAVMTELLGVGIEDRDEFKRCADAIIHTTEGRGEAAAEAQRWIFDYLENVLPERAQDADPEEDLVSMLLQPPPDARGQLTHDEVVGFCTILLLAGTETTTNALGNILHLLERNPALRAELAARPESLPLAIEECLRLESPVQGLSRVASRDVEVLGEKIREGERLHMLFGSANRDERVFPDAEQLDPRRDPNPHLSFGLGIHFCLGASLARTELRVGLEELLARYPGYALDRERSHRQASDTNRGFTQLTARLAGPA
ncbi:MAG: cytochrome P450 [Myxococcales bacterium]|nr:cytochrome P450 [Myxococcales bacterium]